MSSLFAADIRKFLLLLGVVFTVALMTACSQSPESIATAPPLLVGDSPESIVEKFIAQQKRQRGCHSGRASMTFGEGGVTAYVTYELKLKNGETEEGAFTLVEESGQWKTQVE